MTGFPKARMISWCGAFLTALLACGFYATVTQEFNTPSLARVLLFPMIGAAGLAMVFLMRPVRSFKASLYAIWIPALLLRLALLPTAPSDDVNRYLWEGHIVAQGLNPYAAPAADPMWEDHRDSYWEAMNHKDKATAYPPLALGTFALITQISYHPMAFKLCFLAADLLTLGGILSLLKSRGLALGFAGFYAFNPLILFAYAGEAHFDALMVAALVWALVAFQSGRTKWAVSLASIASGIKWITLPLIPFFAKRPRLVEGGLALAVLLLPILIFWNSLPELVGGLLQFGSSQNFNGPVYAGLLSLGLPRIFCTGLMAIVLCAVVLWRWMIRSHAPVDSHIRWILGSLIVLSPTVHFWYLAWIVPFVCLRPSMPWLTFSLSGGAYFFVWTHAAQDAWALNGWQIALFWGPFFIACIYELWSTRGRVVLPARRSGVSEAATFTIVIPTLNVADRIGGALASIADQSHLPEEVIIVDAGSTDGTVAQARRSDLAVRIIDSVPGRGQQIAAGMEAAQSNWVLVLHADAELPPEALAQLAAAVKTNPDLIGGALGQRFEDAEAALLPIEVLNDLRALFSRTAFGDQTQFFHRQTAVEYELMPKQSLMEDVESSWRTREHGSFLFLGQPARVCHRRWKAEDWLQRFALVMRLVARYRGARLRSRAAATALSDSMYQDYYKDRK